MCQCWAYTECCSYQQFLNDAAKQLALASALHQVKVCHGLFQMQEIVERMNADTLVICMRALRACEFQCPRVVGYTSLTQPFTDKVFPPLSYAQSVLQLDTLMKRVADVQSTKAQKKSQFCSKWLKLKHVLLGCEREFIVFDLILY